VNTTACGDDDDDDDDDDNDDDDDDDDDDDTKQSKISNTCLSLAPEMPPHVSVARDDAFTNHPSRCRCHEMIFCPFGSCFNIFFIVR